MASIRVMEDSFQGSDKTRFVFSKRIQSAMDSGELARRRGGHRESWNHVQVTGWGSAQRGTVGQRAV